MEYTKALFNKLIKAQKEKVQLSNRNINQLIKSIQENLKYMNAKRVYICHAIEDVFDYFDYDKHNIKYNIILNNIGITNKKLKSIGLRYYHGRTIIPNTRNLDTIESYIFNENLEINIQRIKIRLKVLNSIRPVKTNE